MQKIFSKQSLERYLSWDTVFVLFLLGAYLILFVYEKNYMYLRQVDATFYVEAINNVANVGKPLSVANHSSQDFLRNNFV